MKIGGIFLKSQIFISSFFNRAGQRLRGNSLSLGCGNIADGLFVPRDL